VVEVANLPRPLGAPDRVDLLLGAPRGDDRHLARQQVVAAVAVLDLDDVAGRAQVGHVGREDDLHGPSSYRAVEV
jgi:hypothetical protein